MPGVRTLKIDTLTRVEGEGALYARLRDGVLEEARFDIYETPRLFEGFLHNRPIEDAPDLTARICGICPVAYQMTACHAIEAALGVTITPEIRRLRRLFYCAEWIASHAVHIFLLHLPDFFGCDSVLELAADHPDRVRDGLRLKKLGNRLLEAVGGRATHPVNTAIGGFHRAPSVTTLRGLAPELEWGLQAAVETLRFAAELDYPSATTDYELVTVSHPDEYPMNEGRVVSNRGLDIPMAEYEEHFEERQVATSTALHSLRKPGGGSYLVGPLARINLCYDRLSPTAKREADGLSIDWSRANNQLSLVARAVETIDALEEALALVRDYHAAPAEPRVTYTPRDAVGAHATEAPRGLLYHCYVIRSDGKIETAKIVPPTSQNQARVEADLRDLLTADADRSDAELADRCERLIRSYDPCISCATHFLKLRVDRDEA